MITHYYLINQLTPLQLPIQQTDRFFTRAAKLKTNSKQKGKKKALLFLHQQNTIHRVFNIKWVCIKKNGKKQK